MKRNIWKKLLLGVLLLLTVLLLSACGEPIEVTGVTLNQTELSLECGETSTLIATVIPGDASDQSITWACANPEVATVDASGRVTAVGEGQTTITAISHNGVIATCHVQVVSYAELEQTFVFEEFNGKYRIKQWLKPGESLTVPASYRGKPVVELAEGAFKNSRQLKSVYIPDSVETIGKGVFQGCNQLESMTLPFVGYRKGMANSGFIGRYFGAPNLEECYTMIPESLKTVIVMGGDALYDGAFCDARGLETVMLPNTIQKIGEKAFYHCEKLSQLFLPEGVTEIGEKAFSGCRNLFDFQIPAGVTKIGIHAFSGMSFSEIKLPEGLKEISHDAFRACAYLKTIEIPDSVTSIGVRAFMDCHALSSVKLGKNLKSIATSAFSGCKSLTALALPDSMEYLGDAFLQGTAVTELIIPAKVSRLIYQVTYGANKLERLSVAEGNPLFHSSGNCVIETETGILLFGCKTSVIPDDGSVTSIGKDAFRECTGLKNIVLPDSITRIEQRAFAGCTDLAQVTFSEGLNYIGKHAFYECDALRELVFPDTLERIDENAFQRVMHLESVVFGAPGEFLTFGVPAGRPTTTDAKANAQLINSQISGYWDKK